MITYVFGKLSESPDITSIRCCIRLYFLKINCLLLIAICAIPRMMQLKNKTYKRGKHLMNNYRSKLFIGEPTELMS